MPRHRTAVLLSSALLLTLPLAGCSAIESSSDEADAASADALWDRSKLHTVALDVDPTTLSKALQDYADSQEKTWISANVTIDGVTFENVGMKLKGNSSLRGVTADSDPATLPWIIRLDKFVDDQSWDGQTELVVRGNSSETSLNEAVALTMLDEAGLASESAIATSFSVNDSDAVLRLTIQNPDDEWTANNFADGTLLYKSEAEGSWDYVGDDPADYADAFDQEAGEEDDTPLIDFLQFVNESDDTTFHDELADHLDVDAFATYLAFQDLVSNMDDIDGPGNNSYLAYDPGDKRMTVVNWDLNLAFGMSPGGGGMGSGARTPEGAPTDLPTGGPGGGQMPAGTAPTDLPDGFDPENPPDGFDPERLPDGADAGGFGGGMGGISSGNILSKRFEADDEFAALVDAASQRLQTELVDSGDAQTIIDEWKSVLTTQAGDLVDADTVTSDASSIEKSLGLTS
ncbi:CotH kinase family protein [Microbacterium gorillae]|uniref:CotH kinase family protein n=1 Tax=Microbacterium gorillae TaxID=1231063 RepID=UPI00058D94EB|nr:CotH kinase family protein [Microbacterium gorillae]